jgi:prevent-host-death family protein
MERTIGAFEARRNFGKVLQEVVANGDKVIVERHGEPVAVVVPVDVYRQWQRSRQAFFDKLQDMAGRADMSPEEADELAEEAVKWARGKNKEA